MASDLIEDTVRRESETRSGSIPAGMSLRSVVKGGKGGVSGAESRKGPPVIHFRMGGTAASRACGALGNSGWYLCRHYTVQDALAMGLVNKVVPLADLR